MSKDRPSEDLVRAVRAAGISDERLLQAVRTTPRAPFVPAAHAPSAYQDVPLPIGHGQVTTQPSLSAMMIDGLDLHGREHVLEVGTGLGFQTALLARLAADVVSIEWWPDIAQQARRNLDRQNVPHVELRVGDGSAGVPDRAPYDAILVSAAFPDVPAPLVEQLPDRRPPRTAPRHGRARGGRVLPADRLRAGAPASPDTRPLRPPPRPVRLYAVSAPAHRLAHAARLSADSSCPPARRITGPVAVPLPESYRAPGLPRRSVSTGFPMGEADGRFRSAGSYS